MVTDNLQETTTESGSKFTLIALHERKLGITGYSCGQLKYEHTYYTDLIITYLYIKLNLDNRFDVHFHKE